MKRNGTGPCRSDQAEHKPYHPKANGPGKPSGENLKLGMNQRAGAEGEVNNQPVNIGQNKNKKSSAQKPAKIDKAGGYKEETS